MATDSGYAKRDFLRVCDICGHRFHFSQLKPIGELKFACPDDAPGLTALQISRYNARARPLVVRPNKHAKALTHTPIYQLAEAEIFNFIAQVAPAAERDGERSALAAAWAAIYMADVVTQDKRPAIWYATAKKTIKCCLEFLLTQQYGSYTGTTGTADNPRYGGILVDTTYSTAVTIAAGVAFLKGYAVTGTPSYLDGAKRCATFMRHTQSGDVQATAYTVYPAAGGRYHIGGLASGVDDTTGLLLTTYLTADIAALWFLKLLADVVGEATMYGDAVPTAFFGTNRASLATMIAELTTFAELGPRDSTTNELTPGLSTTAPRATYLAGINGGGGTAAWEAVTDIYSDDIAMALRGLYESGGVTAKVEEMMAWLAAFTSNANNRTPANVPESVVVAGITGTYNPAIAPATRLKAAAPFTESDAGLYSWASLGLLAPILSSTAQAAFRVSKDTASMPRRYSTNDITTKYLGPIGASGLSLQPRYLASLTNPSFPPGQIGVIGGSGIVIPSVTEGEFWFEADSGVTVTPGTGVTAWADKTDNHRDVTALGLGHATVNPTGINGLPSLTCDSMHLEYTGPNLFEQGDPRSVLVVCKPVNLEAGHLLEFRRSGRGFGLGLWRFFDGKQYLYTNCIDGADNIWQTPTVDYTDQTLLILYEFDGVDLTVTINGTVLVTNQTDAGAFEDGAGSGFLLLNACGASTGFRGEISLYMCAATPTIPASFLAYASTSYGFAPAEFDSLADTQTVVLAAKTGSIYRYAPGHYPQLKGNEPPAIPHVCPADSSDSSVELSPSLVGLAFWFEADRGITTNGSNEVTDWVDHTGNGWDVHTPSLSAVPPTFATNVANGQPGVYFGNPGAFTQNRALDHYGPPFYDGPASGVPGGSEKLFGEVEPNIVISVVRPDATSDSETVSGGMLFSNRVGYFARELWTSTNGPTKQRLARTTGGPNDLLYTTPVVSYTNQVLVVVHRWDGANMFITVNGVSITTIDFFTDLPSTVLDPVLDVHAGNEMLMVGGSAADAVGFKGHILGVLGYRGTTVPEETITYLATKYGAVI